MLTALAYVVMLVLASLVKTRLHRQSDLEGAIYVVYVDSRLHVVVVSVKIPQHCVMHGCSNTVNMRKALF